jgi:TonB-dependent receptor
MSLHHARIPVRVVLFCCLVLTAGPQVFAQGSGTVRGKIMDKSTGDPLPGAHVVVVGTSLGAATSLDGAYVIHAVPAGPCKVKASYVGYADDVMDVQVVAGAAVEMNFKLKAQVIEGETVVITAQAQGQNAAINQQLSSNTISNVVSGARIKELPDVNAAESIGRLPGVAINRSNGEASSVVIRGLSPKYNAVTVNGVPLPATGGDDRSVDLSLVSSNILDGIELKKANTPDMEASALGGTVDLKLKEAPVDPIVNVSAQAGYNRIHDDYGNYAFTGNYGQRFLDGDLGVIASINSDRYNRSADKFSASYTAHDINGQQTPGLQGVTLRDEAIIRKRAGGSLLLDYAIPFGKASVNGFFNQLEPNSTLRINQPDAEHNSHYYGFEQSKAKTNVFTVSLGLKQDFDLFKYDVNFSRAGTAFDDPDHRVWGFAQENAAFAGASMFTQPFDLPQLETIDSAHTGFQSAYINSTKRWEYQNSAQLNIQVPFRVTDDVTGYLKFGGTYRWLDRRNDETQWGRDGLQYGSNGSVSAALTVALRRAAAMYPNDYNWNADSTLTRTYGVLPITRFLDGKYDRSNFLDGNWPQKMVANFDLLNKFTDAMSGTSEWKYYGVGSLGRDYAGAERYQAAYVMTELKYSDLVTLIPGVRWERYSSAYHGQVFRDVKVSNIEQDPTDLQYIYVERDNQFLLPMVHLIVAPSEWLKIRLARTETLTQPDYMMYAPITSMNSNNNYCRAANSLLKPARSYNWDASISVFNNDIGLLSVSGFYKDVYDLIMQTTIYYKQPQASDDPGIPLPDGLNIPKSWLAANSFQLDTYTNNAARAIYKGFEVEWQTHFWYLPSVFKGIVLNVNYSRIWSQTYKDYYSVVPTNILIPGHRPPLYRNALIQYSQFATMPDQPGHTVNVSIGYDYEGFSGRLIYLYQSGRTTFLANKPEYDSYTEAYSRFDIALQQKIGWGLQVYANLNNLNNRHDQTHEGYTTLYPTYQEYYGFTMDVGVRFSL